MPRFSWADHAITSMNAGCCAAACGACNPCAAACGACNPCAAANPSNPCAACNPCNPCAGACGACGASYDVELTPEEAQAAYDCIRGAIQATYAESDLLSASGDDITRDYSSWSKFNTAPYQAFTHGGRYVNNYVNATGAAAYGNWEQGGAMPAGSVLVKDSVAVDNEGRVGVGPFFVMEKMGAGFNADSGDWRYSILGSDGQLIGITNGAGSGNVAFCIDCHIGAERDSMLFIPDEFRIK